MAKDQKSFEQAPKEAQTLEAADVGSLETIMAPAKTAAPEVPESTVRVFFAGRLHDPIVQSFISCEERKQGTRKLPDAEWATLYQAFLTAPR